VVSNPNGSCRNPHGISGLAVERSLTRGLRWLQVERGEHVLFHPGDGGLEGMVGVGGSGVFDELCPAAVAPCGYHHPPRGAPSQVGAGVLADQMQTRVQARCHSCRRQNGALVDEQDTGVDVDVGIPPRQLAGRLPMRGGSSAGDAVRTRRIRLVAAVCKAAAFGHRGFESLRAHQTNDAR
jgi:hypothetical protein